MDAAMTDEDNDFKQESTPQFGVQSLSNEDELVEPEEWMEEKTTLLGSQQNEDSCVWLKDSNGEIIDVKEFPFVIGRHAECQHQIRDSNLSRKHSRIIQQENIYIVEDLGSQNGTYVNGHKVERAILVEKDEIVLGGRQFIFLTKDPVVGDSHLSDKTETSSTIEKQEKTEKSSAFIQLIKKPVVQASLGIGIVALVFMNFMSSNVNDRVISSAQMNHQANLQIQSTPKVVTPPSSKVVTKAPVVVTNNVADEEIIIIEETTTKTTQGSQNGNKVVWDEPDQEVVLGENTKYKKRTIKQKNQPKTQVALLKQKQYVPPKNQKVVKKTPPKKKWKPTKKVSRSSDTRSKNAIKEAKEQYLSGQFEAAISSLEDVSTSTRHRSKYRRQAKKLKKQIEGLFESYQQGKEMLQNEDDEKAKDKAFVQWAKFNKEEKSLFYSRQSSYVAEVRNQVVTEYMKSASKAEKEGRLHDAYRLWTKASSVNGSAQAEAAIQKLQDLARETFLKGYRQENVNLTRAKAYWQEVLEIVPPGTTYHTKASAKLGWYSRYNR